MRGAAVAKTLRAWRTERLMSTRRLADLAGSSNKTIVQLENGRQTATFATIEKLSRALNVTPRDVIEFARAIDVRAGVGGDMAAVTERTARRKAHVFCVSDANVFEPLAILLLETGQYGVTTVVGVPLTPERVACAQPDIVVLDVDSRSIRELLHGMLDDRAGNPAPIVVTARDRGSLDAFTATLEQAQDDVAGITFASRDQDVHELVIAVESCGILA
jgi:transcriptional regulator with XRE-family HTH domain